MESSTTAPISNVQSGHLRACASCARAKAKCVTEDNGKCQRCHRLKRICEAAQAQPRNHPRKRRSEASQKSHVAKLEEKLDGLVTLLQKKHEIANNESAAPITFNTAPVAPDLTTTRNTTFQTSPVESSDQGWIHLKTPTTPSTQSETTPAPSSSYNFNHQGPPIPDEVVFSPHEANFLLNRWRDRMASFCPFIVISPSLSAQNLQRDRPYLLKAILAVSTRDAGQQLAIGRWLVRSLTERMVINGERNLDLLLGVLTFTGWSFYNCYNVPQLTCLLSLGMSLIFDMGLHRPPPNCQSHRSLFEIALRETANPGNPRPGAHIKLDRNMEDRRVLLGMFFISSAASKFFRSKLEPLRVTPYIYECLENLGTSQEHPSDTSAVAIVRLQLIEERIRQAPWNSEYEASEQLISAPPAILYVKAIQEQLKDFKRKMAPEIACRGNILMHLYHVEESLYEVALSRSPALSTSTHDFPRLEMLYACLQSNKLFLETFFAIPEYHYPSLSLASWTQTTHSLMILQLLSTFDHPDWNLNYVRDTIDFMEVMDKIIARFHKVEGEIFERTAAKMASIKAHIQGQMSAPVAKDGAGGPDLLNGQDLEMGNWEPFDFTDESWFVDMLAPLDYSNPSMI